MFAVYTLFSSLLLVVVLFLFKHWELKRGKQFFAEGRRRADVFITEHIPYLHRRTVKASREFSREAAMLGLHYVTSSLLSIVRAIEQRLANVVNMIRGRNTVVRRGNASSFLMKVSEHKKVDGKNNSRLKKNSQ